MSTREIKTIFAIDGEKKYNDAIKDINEEQKRLNAEYKAAGAAAAAAGDKQGKLRIEAEKLNKDIELQKKRVEEAKNAVEQSTAKYGENAKSTQELKIQYYNAEAALSKLQGQLIATNKDLANQESKLKSVGEAAERAGKKIQSAGSGMSSAGSALTNGVTVPLIAAGTALAGVVTKATENADEIAQTAEIYGLTTDRVQELSYAGKALDVDLETMTKSQTKLIKSMSAAEKGTGTQAEAFAKLGVNIKDANGNFKDSDEIWGEVLEKLGGVSNETERDSIAMELLGKSAMELNPLINAGADGIDKLTKAAHDNGAVLSGDEVAALDEFGDTVDQMKQEISTASAEIAVELMPTFKKLYPIVRNDVVPAIKDLAEFIGNLADMYEKLSPQQQDAVVKLVAITAALGPFLKLTGGITSTVGKATTAVGGLLTKLGNKGVIDGVTQSTTKLGTSAAGASSSVGMLGVAMLATAAASAAIIYGFEKAGEKYDKMSAYVEDFENGVASAHAEIESGTSILSNYSSALTTGSEAMSGYDAGISAAQSRIIELAQLAASETREYTDAEKEEIQKLIDLITDYTGKKVDAYAQQQGIVSSMVSNETVMDKDAAAKYVASAKDAAQQVIDASTKARTDAYAEAVQLYGAGGEKDKEAYQQLIDNADYAYNEQVRIANQGAHDTILAITAKYYEQNVKDTEYMIAYEDICKRLEEAEKSKNDYITDLWEELGVAEENRNEDNQYYLGVMNAADNKYKNELEAIYEDEANLRGKDGEDAVEYMMALRDDYTVYGQEAIDAAQRVAAGVAAPFGDLASTFYGFGANTINGLISGMQANTPGAYTAAEEAAKGIASAYAKKQKINSPSKVMIGLGVNTMAGLPIGMRSKEQEIRDTAADIANAIPEEIEKAPSPEAMIKMQYDQSGLDTVMRSAGAASIKLSAVGNAASASGLSSVKQVVHSGELTVKGVNNQGEVVGVSKIIMDQLKLDNMMAGR